MVNAGVMNTEILTYALLGGLAIALLVCMVTDLRDRKIYNVVTGPMALAAPLFWFATGEYGWGDIGMHIATGLAAFVFCIVFFRIGWMGGGDLKLYTALALWFSWVEVVQLFLYGSIIGLLLTMIYLMRHKKLKKSGKAMTPYGVAISIAGLLIAGERIFNHFG